MTYPLPKLEYPLPMKPAPDPPTKPSITDSVFWYSVFESMGPNPKIDFDILADLCRYKNANTARTMLCIKRKLMKKQLGVGAPRWVESARDVIVKREMGPRRVTVKKEKGAREAGVKEEKGASEIVKKEMVVKKEKGKSTAGTGDEELQDWTPVKRVKREVKEEAEGEDIWFVKSQ